MAKANPRINSNKDQLNKNIAKGIGKDRQKLECLDDRVVFSLKYLDLSHSKFNLTNCEVNYYNTLLGRLRDLSGMTMNELFSNRSSSLRFNTINFDDPDVTEDSFGLPNEEELVTNPREFELSRNEHGRVHGFCIDNVFYIRWLDPDHNLCASKNYKK